jgi:D-sedoheptulose 7-phosphate isomerase
VSVATAVDVGSRFFGAEADRLALLCREMAERFARGGRLIALGETPAARSDARHVAVEFVHPVIVGKRALPALAVEDAASLQLLLEPDDIVIAFGDGSAVTIAFGDGGPGWEFRPPVDDPFVRQELIESLYHFLWEHVHVFLESRTRPHDSGAASFLYPQREADPAALAEDVRQSILMKAAEVGALRAQTLDEGGDVLRAAAAALRDSFAAGGKLLALGNGGSATDAMDVVADLRAGGHPCIDLTDDTAILTAIANDIGTEAIFARQVIAYGRGGDVLLALSTSGNSDNVIAALAEARRRGLVTVALVGYDGGRVAAEKLADHVVVTRSEHIPRIQEAQASAYHALVELVG